MFFAGQPLPVREREPRMNVTWAARQRGVALGLLVLLSGCTAPRVSSGDPAPPGEAPASPAPLHADTAPPASAAPLPVPGYSSGRYEAWNEVKRIAKLFAKVPAQEFPGLAGLAADVEQLQQQIETKEGPRLEAIDADSLIARNPHFWRASFEVASADPLVPAFAALVHFSAGQPGFAHELLRLVRAGPLLPEPLDRVLHQHLGRTVESGLPELEEIMRVERPPEELVARLEALRRAHPQHALVANVLIAARRQRAGLPMHPTQDGEQAELVERVLDESVEEVKLVERAWPLTGLLHRRDRDLRREVLRVWPTWMQTMDARFGLGPADFEALANVFSRAGLVEHALLSRRLMAAARGFPSPADVMFAQRELPRLLGANATPLIAAWDRGEIRQLSFFDPDLPPAGDRYRPLHPVLAESLERSRRTVNHVLAEPIDEPGRMAQAYAWRTDVLRQLNRPDEAAADLERLIALEGESPRSTRLRLHLAMERWNEAAALAALEACRRVAAEDPETWHEQAMVHALQGRWSEAGEAFGRLALVHDDAERAGFAAMHAATAYRFAGQPVPTELWKLRDRNSPESWIGRLLAALANPAEANQLFNYAAEGSTELERVGRRCEALLVLASLQPPGSEEAKAHLENCVRTGVVDFIEYQLARMLLRQLDPERWDERRRPSSEPTQPPSAPRRDQPLDFESARPRLTAPA
jgi:tetratricopeptide (TPR) repeat protein